MDEHTGDLQHVAMTMCMFVYLDGGGPLIQQKDVLVGGSSSGCLSNLLIYTWRETRESSRAPTMKDASQAAAINVALGVKLSEAASWLILFDSVAS